MSDVETETPPCDLCGSVEHDVLFAAKDRRHNYPGEFQLVQCSQCALRYVSPRPTAATIQNWYPRSYKAYKPKSALAKVADFLEDNVWNAYLKIFLSRSYPTFFYPRRARRGSDQAPRLLDVGCGSGDKLRYIRSKSAWQTYGVDFSPQAVENANASGAGDVRLTTGDKLPFDDEFFDSTMSWHSLEHHYSPRATMREVARVMRPGGYGIFAVPSGDNVGLRTFRSYWGPLEVPRHLYYFTRESMTRLLTESGFQVKRVYYDFSFYGLFLDQEIFESLELAIHDKVGWFGLPLQLPLKLLRAGGLVSSAATLPILPVNRLLGRLWRGSNMIFHFTKPANA